MAIIGRVPVVWQGWPGAPGVTQLYMDSPVQAEIDAVRSMFNAMAALLPSGLTITVPQSGDTIEDTTGAIVGTWSVGSAPAVVTGTGAGAYAGNAGAVIHWLTADVINGRRVRGRTFIVPLIGSAFATDGSLAATTVTTLTTAANGYLTALGAQALVWHRPTQFAQGGGHSITATRVPDLAVSLRSRRI